MENFLFTVIMFIFVTKANSYPYGAPCSSFDTLRPSEVFHGISRNSLTDPPPFELNIFDSNGNQAKFYKVNQTYTIQLKSVNLNNGFRGFLMQARVIVNNSLMGNRVGRFLSDGWINEGVQYQDCQDSNHYDSVTHSNNDLKRQIQILWQPVSQEGPVQFVISIVEELHVFWDKWQPPSGFLFLAKSDESLNREDVQIKPAIPTSVSVSNLRSVETHQPNEGVFLPDTTANDHFFFTQPPHREGPKDSLSTIRATSISTFVIDFGKIDVVEPPPTPSTPFLEEFRLTGLVSKFFDLSSPVSATSPSHVSLEEAITNQPVPKNSLVDKKSLTQPKTDDNVDVFTTANIFLHTPSESDFSDNFNLANFDLITRITQDTVATPTPFTIETRAEANATTSSTVAPTTRSFSQDNNEIIAGRFNSAATHAEFNSSDPCSQFPCFNNATCRTRPDENSFECICTERWTGFRCDTSNTSANQKNNYEGHMFRCIHCKNCYLDPNNCIGQKCRNGATCVNGESNYTCICPPNYAGNLCQNYCPDYLCGHGGRCIIGPNQFFACLCAPGWTGEHCKEEIDECASNPCQFGKCFDRLNGFECKCPTGIMGTRCHRPCQDVYHSCSLWREEDSCDQFRNQTTFFDQNCAVSCGMCVADNKILNDSMEVYPVVLEPLIFLLGKWSYESTNNQKFPVDFNGRFSSYNNHLEFLPAAANMFGASSIKYKTTAVRTNDPDDVVVTQGFLTLIPRGEVTNVALYSSGNDGVTIMEEGSLQNNKIVLRTIEYSSVNSSLLDQASSNLGRTFDIVDTYLRETVERVSADGVPFVFANYYRLIQSYAPF